MNGEWQEQVSFFNVVAWADLGENAAASLQQGHSRDGHRSTRATLVRDPNEGEKRNITEVIADDLGPSLRWAQAQVERIQRDSADGGGYSGGGSSGGGGGGGGGGSRAAADPVYGDEEPF